MAFTQEVKEECGGTMFSGKVGKYVEFAQTKCKACFAQRKLQHKDVTLKYMLDKAPSDVLVVVFSARTREGLAGRYNYVRTLKNVAMNRLFILDDFAEDKRGAYYLGESMQFTIEEAVHKLVAAVQQQVGASTVIFCGSSKGGWAALNFGVKYPNARIIAGAPQYYLADYLAVHGTVALDYITNIGDDAEKQILNHYLENNLLQNEYYATQKIYFHYSDNEHTYEEHVQDLLATLYQKGYEVHEERMSYTNHWDISRYFPAFLLQSISEAVKEEAVV